MKRLKEITFEVDETITFSGSGTTTAAYCPACGGMVAMATTWLAAIVHGSTEREIFRLIESGTIECIEGGRLLACLGCLSRFRKVRLIS